MPLRAARRLALLFLLLPVLSDCKCASRPPAALSATPAASPRKMHDHTPHHGGIVAMNGMVHLEALALPAGTVRVYVTDRWRQPVDLAAVQGTVSVSFRGGWNSVPLVSSGEALEARGPALPGQDANAHVALRLADGQQIEQNFSLPLSVGRSGAAGIPARGCVPVGETTGGRRAPRCTLQLDRSVTAVAMTPSGGQMLIAAVDVGLSAWQLPGGIFALGFAPPPPIEIPSDESPHPDAVNAVAVRSDGAEVAIALEGRLLIYDGATGHLARELPRAASVLRALAWSPDGTSILVAAFYDRAAHLIDARDGREIRRFTVDLEAATVAFAPTGALVAVSSEAGPIALFDRWTGQIVRTLAGAVGPSRACAVTDDRVVAVTDDGALRVWDTSTGEIIAASEGGPSLWSLAIAPDQQHAAAAGLGGRLRVYDLRSGAVAERLDWHSAQILGLAWREGTLVSGDMDGIVALWDMPAG